MTLPREGVLLVDKPPGPTSHDVVRRARSALRLRRIGHAGTLDPFASGLLILCLGPSTRLAEYLSGMDKCYRATARLGVSTTTHDPEGRVVRTSARWRKLDEHSVEAALECFRGEHAQRPPRYSAKKVQGKAAYRKARRGEAVELQPVNVIMHEIKLTECALPLISFRVRCSSGTYIRALARDLGVLLGVGAHLTGLRRTRVGPMTVDGAVSPDSIGEAGPHARLSPAEALAHLPRVCVGEEEAARIACGQALIPAHAPLPDADPVAVTSGKRLVAVGFGSTGVLRPRKVFR